ncbi:MAG: CHASE domain-containing protein, partial [Myxococcaceae bacterium]|nr:CHASE domain-containing protein [Myxococcaceae bacterium]
MARSTGVSTRRRVPTATSPGREEPRDARAPVRRVPVPLLVLLSSLLLTGVATAFAALAARAGDEADFANAVQATQDRIEARLEAYIALLRGAAALFAASERVSAAEFRAYVERLDVMHRYPGVQGIGFSQRVRPGQEAALVARRRAEGVPDFHLWPDAGGREVHTVLFLEPTHERHLAALGFDMSSEPTRREAMARARDTGAEALSGKVTLVKEPETERQAGFLLYVPVYRGGALPASAEGRRAALEGFVYSPFRADDLFAGIFGTERDPRVAFQVYDGPVAAPEHLLYDSRADTQEGGRRPAFSARSTVEVAGRPWTLEFESRQSFEEASLRSLPQSIAGAGALVSLALYALTLAQARARQRAERA